MTRSPDDTTGTTTHSHESEPVAQCSHRRQNGMLRFIKSRLQTAEATGRPVTKLIPLFFWIGMVLYIVVMPNFSLGTGSICLFQHLTGYDCPGCGMTRSSTAFAWGQLQESLTYHPGGSLFVTWLTGVTLYRTAEFLRRHPFDPPKILQRSYHRFVAISLIILIIFGISRLASELAGITRPITTLDIPVR